MKKRRVVLRQDILHSMQSWIPDTRSLSFAQEARRQSMLLRDDPHEQEILDWIEAVTDIQKF